MASARGDALDWALALARVPGERHALRQRPLPGGMDTVMQIAGGSHAAVIQDAAAYASMAPAEVVEAARFYLREMLFFPDADVYRVLGLASDASDEQIKHHHRLLQQWLHPDRPTSDWDAAFAARVNAAWSQLRTPARREAHAARVGEMIPAAPTSEPSWTQPARIPAVAMSAQEFDPSVDDDRWRRRAPVLALFAICAVLGVLAVRDMQREPETNLAAVGASEGALAEASPTVALRLPVPAEKDVSGKKPMAPKRVAAVGASRTTPQPVAAIKPTAKPVAPVAARPAAVAVASKPISRPLPKSIEPPARPAARPLAAVAAVARPKLAPPKPAATAVAQVAPPKPRAVSSAAAPIKPTAKIAAAPVKPVAKAVAAVAPAPGKLVPKSAAAPLPAKPVAKAVVAVVPAPPKPSSKSAVVPVKPVAKPVAAVASAAAKPAVKSEPNSAPTPVKPAAKPLAATAPVPVKAPAVVASKTPVAPIVAVAKPAPKPPARPEPAAATLPEPKPAVAAATVATPPEPTNSPAQMAQAQQTGQRLLAFVTGRGSGTPPIWANLGAQKQASRAREALQGNGRIAVGTRDWRLGGANAGMQATLTPADGKAQHLRVDLVWREQRWLVTGLALEQAP